MSSADKLLTALSLFTADTPEWTVESAADALNVSGSTAYRYFSSLTKVGLLDPAAGGRYVLGPAIMTLDLQLRSQDPLIKAARPVMNRLVRRNGGLGVALLCRPFRQQVMCIHQAFEHTPEHAVSYERGRPMVFYRGAASLVIMAHLPSRTLKKLWTEDADAIAAAGLGRTWDELRNTLKAIRRAGVYVSFGHLDKGVVGVSAPVWQADRQIAGSISLVVPDNTVSVSDIAGMTALVQAAANEIGAALAGTTSSHGAAPLAKRAV